MTLISIEQHLHEHVIVTLRAAMQQVLDDVLRLGRLGGTRLGLFQLVLAEHVVLEEMGYDLAASHRITQCQTVLLEQAP